MLLSISYRTANSLKLANLIKSLDDDRYQVLDNTFLIYSEKPISITKINSKLREIISKEDLLFIAEINPLNVEGWLNKSAWEFIKTTVK